MNRTRERRYKFTPLRRASNCRYFLIQLAQIKELSLPTRAQGSYGSSRLVIQVIWQELRRAHGK
jgi:hypothetical protein